MLDERQINLLESLKVPNFYWNKKSKEYQYFFRSLLQKIDSSLIFKGIPDSWSNDFFMICLWAFGYVAVFDTQKWGVSFQPCTLGGYDFYYQPTWAQICNPRYNKRLDVGKNCELLKLTPDFKGVFDVLDFYSNKLSELSKGIDMSILNTKMPVILTASNDSQAETLKAVYDRMQSGESLIIWKDQDQFDEIIPRKDPFEVFQNDYKSTYILGNLLEDFNSILDSFYTEIGIPVSVVDKKAHMLNAEADFQSAQSQARICCWVTTLRESFRKINKMFGLNLEVEYACTNDADRDGARTESSQQEFGRNLFYERRD